MTFRKLLLILTFVVTVVIVTLLGASYAWYQFDNAVTSFDNVQTFTEDVDLGIVFANNNNIQTTVGIPILAAEVEELSNKTNFSITPSSSTLSGKEVAYKIEIVDLIIDSALTTGTDLKYSLLETIGEGATNTIKTGNFYNVTTNTLTIKEATKITQFDTTYNYELRIWLEDNGCTVEQINDPNDSCTSQNGLMGKSLSGKIKISTMVK